VKLKCEEAKLAAGSEEMALEKLLRLLLMEQSPERRAEFAGKLRLLDCAAMPLQGPIQAACLNVGTPSRDAGTAEDGAMPEPLERSVGEAIHGRLKALGYKGQVIQWEYGTFAAVFPA